MLYTHVHVLGLLVGYTEVIWDIGLQANIYWWKQILLQESYCIVSLGWASFLEESPTGNPIELFFNCLSPNIAFDLVFGSYMEIFSGSHTPQHLFTTLQQWGWQVLDCTSLHIKFLEFHKKRFGAHSASSAIITNFLGYFFQWFSLSPYADIGLHSEIELQKPCDCNYDIPRTESTAHTTTENFQH